MKQSEPILSLHEIAELRLQAKQLRSSIIPTHRVDSREAGSLASSALGSGMDYAESRLYQQGDEPRSINWRLSARSTETYVKTYHVESRPSLCIVLDQRRPMVFGTHSRLKATQALRLSTLLIFAAEQHRLKLKIYLIKQSSECLEIDNAADFLAVFNQEQQLREQLCSGYDQASPQTDIADTLSRLEHTIESGALLYLISDFHDLKQSHQQRLFQLQQRYFLQALHIIDPAEQSFQKLGGMYLQDMHSNECIKLNSEDRLDSNLTQMNQVLSKHVDTIKQVLLKSSVHYSSISTLDELLHPSILFPVGH